MANTRSAKKAIRSSAKKQQHNLFWKRRIRAIQKEIKLAIQTGPKNTDILNEQQAALQKVVDKAAKENIIHKNKAKRIKSRFAKKIAAHAIQKKETKTKPTGKPGKKATTSTKSRAKKSTKSKSSKK